ncbi:hypothetical protein thalar_02854 [Litoreibacter arenae DSM 19593]|uniref:Uncharacterized protein n=1 Tax=Litoreibacter arenae DSM 19593 TaxID=1123360 RepID=S9QC33_9RHOB|nr:hypothetical protein thalar_02854 [Litoreibacter arenae DSM 19593]
MYYGELGSIVRQGARDFKGGLRIVVFIENYGNKNMLIHGAISKLLPLIWLSSVT